MDYLVLPNIFFMQLLLHPFVYGLYFKLVREPMMKFFKRLTCSCKFILQLLPLSHEGLLGCDETVAINIICRRTYAITIVYNQLCNLVVFNQQICVNRINVRSKYLCICMYDDCIVNIYGTVQLQGNEQNARIVAFSRNAYLYFNTYVDSTW